MTTVRFVMVCPRCDRPYYSDTSLDEALEDVKVHVAGQHPDHDPLWFETYPDTVESDFTLTRKGENLQ